MFLTRQRFLASFPRIEHSGKGNANSAYVVIRKVQTHAGSLTSKERSSGGMFRLLVTYLAEEETTRLVRHRSRRPRLIGEREVLDAMPVSGHAVAGRNYGWRT